jgi:hypothetical protein
MLSLIHLPNRRSMQTESNMPGRGVGCREGRNLTQKGWLEPAVKGVRGEGCLHSQKVVVIVKRDYPRVAKVSIVDLLVLKKIFIYYKNVV